MNGNIPQVEKTKSEILEQQKILLTNAINQGEISMHINRINLKEVNTLLDELSKDGKDKP
jgi:hypothetical protein